MRRLTTEELRKLEIINLCDGAKLGYATQVAFDVDEARVLSLIIEGNKGFFGVGKTEDLIIPWCAIETFGEDTILVRMSPNEIASACTCKDHVKYC